MTLLAIDPGRSYKGEATIGWCLFDDWGQEIGRGSINWEQLVQYLRQARHGLLFVFAPGAAHLIDTVLIENFVNNPQSRGGQQNGTSECIGAVELACAWTATQFIRRPPAALGPAKYHAPKGSFAPLAHLRHEDSAFLHGFEYLIETGVLTVPGVSSTL